MGADAGASSLLVRLAKLVMLSVPDGMSLGSSGSVEENEVELSIDGVGGLEVSASHDAWHLNWILLSGMSRGSATCSAKKRKHIPKVVNKGWARRHGWWPYVR